MWTGRKQRSSGPSAAQAGMRQSGKTENRKTGTIVAEKEPQFPGSIPGAGVENGVRGQGFGFYARQGGSH